MKTPTSKESSSRSVAAAVVTEWIRTGDFPDRMLEPVRKDRALIVEMVYGVVRWHRALEWIMMSMMRTKPAPDVTAHLLLGLYQLLYMENVAAYAALNETVEAAKQTCGVKSGHLVNAVLRRAQREQQPILDKLARQPLAVRGSHPDELIGRWARRWSKEQLAALCEWNNSRSRVVIRVVRTAMASYLETLKAAGVEAEPHPFRPADSLVLPSGVRVEELPGYAEGAFVVQDPATLAAPELLAPEPGHEVLDACAAPGGKLLALAERMEGRGVLVAMDLHEDRLLRLRQNLRRAKREEIRVVRADASRADRMQVALRQAGLPELFDRILLDVPCTNTGVLRRRVDGRWRFTQERLSKLTRIQSEILTAAAGFLKPGGALVYSTCSLELEENENLVQAWLAAHPDFLLEESRFLFPPETGTDGAFAARIRRKPSS